ncbi:MAG: ankyrin repeat domain-containing protein, partial [Gammaproteobacteria bacterium]
MEALTSDYKTPLQLAAELDFTDGTKLLLKHGAVVDKISNSSKKTALFYAVEYLQPEIVKQLLAAGA